MKATPLRLSALKQVLEEILGPNFAERKYLLATSGGVDSMTLWQSMSQLVSKESLVVAHFNHDLRGEAAAKDSQLVQTLAKKEKIECILGKGLGNIGAENFLRKERRQFLLGAARIHRCDFILTAHHADDQLETILMRMIRGTGLRGLSGMQSRLGKWVKPFLCFSKEQIESYAKKNQISFRSDHTNQETHYFRNEIRHQILPKLYRVSERHGGKEAFLGKITSMSQELAEASKALDRGTKKKLLAMSVHTPLWTRLDLDKFANLSQVERQKVLRLLLKPLQHESLTRKETLYVCRAIQNKKGCDIPGGIQMSISCGYVFFQNQKQLSQMKIKDLVLQGRGLVCESLGLEIDVAPELARRVKLRFFTPGDRQGKTKLKRIFLERRIPVMERKVLPLLVDKATGETLWFFSQTNPLINVRKAAFPFTFLASID